MKTPQSLVETEADKPARLLQNGTMKLLVLALTIALLFTAGEALNCHRCVPRRAGEDCELTVETCKPKKNGCAAAAFLREPYGHYQKCMALSDCEMLKLNAYINIKCCNEDMCNTL
ncbi:CD59 glycoprotein [Parambassis ranga]|uniref:CD59 glycoprotein n=1 Tax=Parambassis ranga TaxID=210632 RepID=A0A6P7K2Z5_9TELE|nr:CD59 glycoprotein-like [Parambassis ranga]